MVELRLTGRVKRVGNSLAFFIPAAQARRAGIREGEQVEATLRTDLHDPRGLLSDIPYEPFDRKELWRDRV